MAHPVWAPVFSQGRQAAAQPRSISVAGASSLPDCNTNGNEAYKGGESSDLWLHAACAGLTQLWNATLSLGSS